MADRYHPDTLEPPRLHTSKGRPIGRGTLALTIAIPLVLGLVGGGLWGYALQNTTPSGKDVSFTLAAYMTSTFTGFKGVGGSIDGQTDPTLSVNQYDRVTIVLVDTGSTTHNLYVGGYNLQSPDVSGANASTSVHFVATQVGTFDYYCSIPGHAQMGMQGKLVVGSGQGGPAGPGAIGAEVLPVSDIVRAPSDVPPPILRNYSATVDVYLNVTIVNGQVEPGVSFTYWTFNGKVPGPFLRVRVNDTVVVHFHNGDTMMNHSVDFHALQGPGGGMYASDAAPGQTNVFSFKALVPGLFVYHCGSNTPPVHISEGMFGMILVQPATPLPTVDAHGNPIKEFYVMQSELYFQWPIHTKGNQLFDGNKLLNETPTYVVFNGAYRGPTGNHSLQANLNDTVRIYFGVGGPNVISSFHIIGEIFDLAYPYGDLVDPPLHDIQTILVPPGGSVMVQLSVDYADAGGTNYVLVDHALVNAVDLGALGYLHVNNPTGWTNTTSFNGTAM